MLRPARKFYLIGSRESTEINNALYIHIATVASGVTQADVPVAADAQLHHLRVEADGYQPWMLTLRGVTKDGRVLRGPVRLVPLGATERA